VRHFINKFCSNTLLQIDKNCIQLTDIDFYGYISRYTNLFTKIRTIYQHNVDGVIDKRNTLLNFSQIFRFFMIGALPIGLEFVAEITFPMSEFLTSGLLNISANVSVVYDFVNKCSLCAVVWICVHIRMSTVTRLNNRHCNVVHNVHNYRG
jgi:hypothetical protein